MKRSGFTMIELIFVIVILGILASVAIPKLAATRDDAKASTGATEVAGLLTELGTYYTGHGTLAAKISDITNIKTKETATTVLANSGTITYQDDASTPADCVVITMNSVSDGNISVKAGTGTSGMCVGIQSAIAKTLKSTDKLATAKVVVFGGSSSLAY